jgi:putative redox protein
MPTIKTAYQGDMLFESQFGDHRLLIDLPPSMGGANRGPTPPELFIASLGSCVGAFAATYCEQAGIDTREMSVDVSFDKVDNPTRLTNLSILVNLPYGDCSRRNQALKRVAEHCPVHETIVTLEGIEIEFQSERKAVPA